MSLQRLKGSQRVRQRANVIFGNSDIRGSQQTLFEVASNSLDRHKKGFGDYIKITKHKDLSYTVEDFADGLPMDWNDKENGYNWDLALKILYAGDNYNSDSTAIGQNGLGLCSTQYSSEFMTVISYRNGKKYTVQFKKGRPVDKDTGEYICEDDDYLFTKEQGRRALKVEDNPTDRTGTITHYKPDLEVFTEIDIPIEWILDKFKKQAYVNKGVKIDVIDEISDKTYSMLYENGIKDYIEEVSDDNNLIGVVDFSDEGRGKDREDRDEYDVNYELVFTFNNVKRDLLYFHNSSELLQGGVTAEAVSNAFTHAIHKYLDSNKMYGKGDKRIKFADVEESLICIISSFSTFTSYSNQTKLSIDNKFIKDFVRETLREKLEIYFTENKLEADKICQQVLANSRARDKAEKTRLNIKKKLSESITVTNRVKKFVDCKSKDKNNRELWIMEGDSAAGSCKLGRDSETQALMPIRGKILNCLKADYDRIFKNEIIIDLLKVIGCGVEIKSKYNKEFNTFDLDKLNWNKIIICTDSDRDGYAIRTLILVMFYRLIPSLIKKGYVYIAESPLFEITHGKDTYFAYSDKEKDELIAKLKGRVVVQRSKGLGENEPEMMWDTTMNPETRKMIRVTMEDVEEAEKYFELFLGDAVEPRRDYIADNGHLYMDDLDVQ